MTQPVSADRLSNYFELRLLDPRKLDAQGYPTQVAIIGMLLSCHRDTIRTTADLGRAITRIMTLRERSDYLDGYAFFDYSICCSRCGGAFGLNACGGCRAPNKDDAITHYTGIAVPPRVHAWLTE